jgi:CDP-6-deoxy-D-xylo-4-hexulose-3-dehydrase
LWKLGDLPHGYDHKYTYSHLGYNLKITDMQAACGLAQLAKLSQFIELRKHNFKLLVESLRDLEEFLILPVATTGAAPSWFGFPITLKDEAPVTRLDLLTYLDQERVGTRLLFAGNLTRQPSLKNQTYRVATALANTDKVMENTFWIGLQPSLSRPAIEHSCQKLKAFLAGSF